MLLMAALCPIAMMTFTSPDLDAVQDRYERYLHYELRAEGVISKELRRKLGGRRTSPVGATFSWAPLRAKKSTCVPSRGLKHPASSL